MNNFTYENQGTNTYLVYKVGEDEVLDTMELGMITNNHISGLAQTMCLQMDTSKYIKYNVSAKISVSQFFAGVVNKARLIGVFTGVVNAMLSAEDYMIDPDMILLDLDYIFADVSTCETSLICLPIIDMDRKNNDLGVFFKNIMFSTQFDQTENCDYVAKIMNHLNSMPVFSLVEFKNLLESIVSGSSATAAPAPAFTPVAPVAAPVQQPKAEIKPPVVTPAQQPVAPVAPQPQPVVSAPVTSQPASQSAFQVPGQEPATVQQNNNVLPNGEKPMTKMYLMQHYSKENKAIYDAQQAALKAGAAAPATPAAPAAQSQNAAPASDEKPMSMMYLLQHYSKENKAIYDAQQAAKKAGQASASAAPDNSASKSSNSAGFAIPGQSTPAVNSAIKTPPVQPVAPVKPVTPVVQPPVAPVQPPVAPVQPPVTPVQPPVAPVQPPVAPVQTAAPTGMSMNFGDTTVLSAGMIGETTVLSAGMQTNTIVAPHLIRSKNNEKIPVDKPVFRIGKEKSYVDYFIGDNSTISRSHANIITRNGKYYVVDTNSTNHTFLDGGILQSNSEYEIVHGSKLRFANEDFEFKLY